MTKDLLSDLLGTDVNRTCASAEGQRELTAFVGGRHAGVSGTSGLNQCENSGIQSFRRTRLGSADTERSQDHGEGQEIANHGIVGRKVFHEPVVRSFAVNGRLTVPD